MSNKAFYLDKINSNDKHLVKFSEFKSDLYRFRSEIIISNL